MVNVKTRPLPFSGPIRHKDDEGRSRRSAEEYSALGTQSGVTWNSKLTRFSPAVMYGNWRKAAVISKSWSVQSSFSVIVLAC